MNQVYLKNLLLQVQKNDLLSFLYFSLQEGKREKKRGKKKRKREIEKWSKREKKKGKKRGKKKKKKSQRGQIFYKRSLFTQDKN